MHAILISLWLAAAPARDQLDAAADPTFKPQLVSADFTARRVRPGDQVGVTYRFRNAGSKPARDDWRVFVHLESPKRSCACIVKGLDHMPTTPTSAWEPGRVVTDGPHVFAAPAREGAYYVHVGVFCPQVRGGPRLLDTYAGQLVVSRDAPPAALAGPNPLSADEVARRRLRLARRVAHPAALENDALRFRIDRATLAFDLLDKRSRVLWASNPDAAQFARVQITDGEQTRSVAVRRPDRFLQGPDAAGFAFQTDLRVDGRPTGLAVLFRFELVENPPGVRIRYEPRGKSAWRVRSVRLFDCAFFTTDADDGYLALPRRLGERLDVKTALPRVLNWDTYSQTHMAMCGLVKQGAGLLLAWPEPETRLIVRVDWPRSRLLPGARCAGAAFELYGRSREIEVYPTGRGGYVEIAKTYRPVAKRHGWRVTWAEKRRRFPSVDALFGAADFKPFVFSRVVPSSRFGGKTERTHLGFTFDEAAACAAHWRNDLGVDKAMVVLAGWIHRGYDNQHPDVLPAAPECGGNAALARASERIRGLGFLFGLHDNYQDMYRDAPSWDEKYINKTKDGRLKKGGNWAGGQAWQVCAIKQVELAARPQTNLPMIAKLFHPTIYFIDTTFAWGLVTCDDPAHPMTRYDDMVWKSKLCDLAKRYFGLFGSEEGREWAVPHADYMEGLLSHKTRSPAGAPVIPLFPLVYGDCVNLYTHQGDRIGPGDAKKVLDHVLYAENAVYRFGNHLYWKSPAARGVPVEPLPPKVKAVGPLTFDITYRWKVLGRVKQDLRCFVHFTHPNATRPESIAYQDDHALRPPITSWRPGAVVEIGPRRVRIPARFAGRSELLIGLTGPGGRRKLANLRGSGRRYHLGSIVTTPQGPVFKPARRDADVACFARADDGWAEALCPTDRVIKNTYEVLSYLNRVTAETPMTDHAFVTPDGRVQRSAFGDVKILVNYGPEPYERGDLALPAYGFLVESPTFVAFHASRFRGIEYAPSALFTIRSLDGRPIARSARVRIYHGFGPTRVRVAGRTFQARRERVVSLLPAP